MGLRTLWHMRSREIRSSAGFTCPPPSVLRVSCHPLDGFRPLAPCPPCCRPTAPMGFSLRSVVPRRGWPAFPPASPRVPFATGLASTNHRFGEARACRPTFGYCLVRSSRCCRRCDPAVLRDAPLGFIPLRGLIRLPLPPNSGSDPLTRLSATRVTLGSLPCASECQSADVLPGPKAGHPSQGFAPQPPWRYGSDSPTRAMCSPCRPPRVTARSVAALRADASLPKSSG